MRVSVALVLAAACGRLDFSPRSVDTTCPVPATASDPFTINGRVIAYRTFQIPDGIGGATVTAFDATTGEMLGSARSAGSGQGSDSDTTTGLYSLAISGGIPRRLRLEITANAWNTTEQYTDTLGSDLDGYLSTIWGWGALGAVYGAVDLTLPADSGSDPYGSMDIAVETCDGAGIGSAIVSIDPDPSLDHLVFDEGSNHIDEYGTLTYLGSDNLPRAQPGTLASNPSAVGFFVSTGTNHVTVTAPGFEFPPYDVEVKGSTYSSVIVIHPYE